MSDLPSNQAPPGLPQPPARTDDLFRLVFVVSRSANAAPNPPVVAEVRGYGVYVRQLSARLDTESRRIAATLSDEYALANLAHELMQFEEGRASVMRPHLTEPQSPAPEPKPAAGWPTLMRQLREHMVRELEALRDARLRLELRKAELINQRKGPQFRIVLRGGAQVRLHFGGRSGNAAEKN